MHTQGKNGEGKQSKQGKGQRSGNAKEKETMTLLRPQRVQERTLTAVKYYWAKAEKAVSLS